MIPTSRSTLALAFATVTLFPLQARAARPATGTWSLSASRGDDVELAMRLRSKGHSWSSSFDVPIPALEGFSRGALASARPVATRFTLARDAGTFTFEGELRAGSGAGHFTFAPDAGYASEMAALGSPLTDDGDPLAAALHDVSRPFVRELAAAGYTRVPFDDLVAFRIHGVSPAQVRELRELGYRDLEADDLVAFRIHHVDGDLVRALRASGVDASADELVSLRIHGTTPRFLDDLARLGYTKVAADDLVSMRIHRVTPEFIAELQKLGYARIEPDDLVSMRIHGVTPGFVRRVNERRGERADVEELVGLRIHGR